MFVDVAEFLASGEIVGWHGLSSFCVLLGRLRLLDVVVGAAGCNGVAVLCFFSTKGGTLTMVLVFSSAALGLGGITGEDGGTSLAFGVRSIYNMRSGVDILQLLGLFDFG